MSTLGYGLVNPARLVMLKPVTEDEFCEICQNNPDLRLERGSGGELLLVSPAGFQGGLYEGRVFTVLSVWALQDGRGEALNSNTGVTLPDTSVRALDASWISQERITALDSEDRKRFAHILPEFVIEIRSKSDTLRELQAKMRMYLDNGVALAWLLDPQRCVVEVYRPGQGVEILENPGTIRGEGPVRGFLLDLSRVWGKLGA